jgi:hypothetical protein
MKPGQSDDFEIAAGGDTRKGEFRSYASFGFVTLRCAAPTALIEFPVERHALGF